MHVSAYDEALGVPTEEAATLALRTQQIVAFEIEWNKMHALLSGLGSERPSTKKITSSIRRAPSPPELAQLLSIVGTSLINLIVIIAVLATDAPLIPPRYPRYPGTSGSTQGERNETAPAANAANSDSKLLSP